MKKLTILVDNNNYGRANASLIREIISILDANVNKMSSHASETTAPAFGVTLHVSRLSQLSNLVSTANTRLYSVRRPPYVVNLQLERDWPWPREPRESNEAIRQAVADALERINNALPVRELRSGDTPVTVDIAGLTAYLREQYEGGVHNTVQFLQLLTHVMKLAFLVHEVCPDPVFQIGQATFRVNPVDYNLNDISEFYMSNIRTCSDYPSYRENVIVPSRENEDTYNRRFIV